MKFQKNGKKVDGKTFVELRRILKLVRNADAEGLKKISEEYERVYGEKIES